MTKTKQAAEKTSAEQAVMTALKAKPDMTAAEVASAAGVGRSTASKLLARLDRGGEVRRTAGGREGGRRLPDRWTVAGTKPTAAGERLSPGQLNGLVLAYMTQNAKAGPVGPTAVAKALQRSAGAVGNCLTRLARAKKVRLVNDHPRRYSIAS